MRGRKKQGLLRACVLWTLLLFSCFAALPRFAASAETAVIIPDEAPPAIPQYDPGSSMHNGWVRANGEL